MEKLESVEILGKNVKIVYKNMKNNWGKCDTDKERIILSTKCLKDDKNHFACLAHEVLHYIFHLSGVSYLECMEEEVVVRCIENLFLPWYSENIHMINK